MSAQQEDDSPSKPATAIFDAYERAQKAINQYDYHLQHAALNNEDPRTQEIVLEKHVQMHSTVMNLWRRVRGIVQREYPEYWEESILYLEPDDAMTVEEADKAIVGLGALEGFQGAIEEYPSTRSNRHGEDEVVNRAEPILLPPEACRRTVVTIGELLVEVGWLEPPRSRKTIYELRQTEPQHDKTAEEMIEGTTHE